VAQVPPFAPQLSCPDVRQAPFEQQPPQPIPPQLQAPLVQAWPDPHIPQAAPFDPQTLVFCAEVATHLPVVSQQPPEHDDSVQAQTPPAPQAWPLAQGPQLAPPVPQTVIDCAG
jgi:hypothetical protein